MRCLKLGTLLLLLCSALSWGQPVPLPEPTLPLADTGTPLTLSQQLAAISTRLEQANSDSAVDLEILSQAWTEALRALEEARTRSLALEQDSQSTKAALDNLESSLKVLTKALARKRAELWLWRGLAAGATAGAIAALTWGLTK